MVGVFTFYCSISITLHLFHFHFAAVSIIFHFSVINYWRLLLFFCIVIKGCTTEVHTAPHEAFHKTAQAKTIYYRLSYWYTMYKINTKFICLSVLHFFRQRAKCWPVSGRSRTRDVNLRPPMTIVIRILVFYTSCYTTTYVLSIATLLWMYPNNNKNTFLWLFLYTL